MNKKVLLNIGILLVSHFVAVSSNAAFCSLRDPVLAIHTLYPDATSHRSIVNVVGQETRDAISEQLPFSLHFNEIGKHTLYVAAKKDELLGFVHARSESSDWGLIEVAWGISPQETLEGIYIQRCRDPKCADPVFLKNVRQLLMHKSFQQLLPLLNDSKTQLSSSTSKLFGDNRSLALAIVKSGLKTLKVTELNWATDIDNLRREQLVYGVFGVDVGIELAPLADSEPMTATDTIVAGGVVSTHRVSRAEQVLGHVVHAHWAQSQDRGDFMWLFSPSGEVLDVDVVSEHPRDEITQEFLAMVGKNVADARQCSTATDLAGHWMYRHGISVHED